MGERETTKVVQVSSTAEVLEMIHMGERARSSAATALNEQSSRSHCIVTLFAEGRNADTQEELSVRARTRGDHISEGENARPYGSRWRTRARPHQRHGSCQLKAFPFGVRARA